MAPERNTGAGAEAELPAYAGHYRLESCLGSGGMGVVHLARSTSGMKLAVKVVHAEFAKDPEFRGRFRQEVAAARRVSGAFTASVVDADPEAERPWMATLFIPGPTLSDHVKRNGPMAPAQLRRLMAGLAEALRDIHRVGVVHRDLKPSNVLLAEDGPKVIDFGISRPKDSELRTETGKLIGTPPFMAPEQFRRPREVGPAADVFALGSVLVHAATGRGPFDSDSPYVVAYQVVHDEPDLTGVPEDLAELVSRCLAKEPESRPTPDELMRELRSVAASYDTQAFIPAQRSGDEPPPPVPPRVEEPAQPPARPGRRRRVLLAAGALVLVASGVLTSVQLFGDKPTASHGTARPTAPATYRAWAADPVSGSGAVRCSYGAGKLLCARPGVVFALDPSDGGLLWRHGAGTTRWSTPPVLSGGLVQPLPDHGRHLEALDPASGKVRWERDVRAYTLAQPVGGMILLTHADGTVSGVDGASGETKWSRPIADDHASAFSSFAGDPLAYLFSVSAQGTSTHVTAVDPTTGDVRWDAHLKGSLEPVGTSGGSVFFLAADPVYGDTQAVVRYNPRSGATRRVALPVRRQSAHAGVRGGVVYLLAAGGSLAAVDTHSGKQLWTIETSVSRGSAPVSDGRYVYVSAADGRLLAVDARKGTLAGQTPARLGASTAQVVTAALPTPVLTHNHVYATAPDGTVFAVDARDPSGW
ncbi:serine/threonine-protein kinase [Streptomyces griseorubiginosus]|uniref:serine/threonine-protein kinase n=1 Tax=Streptomyces griseorubiginosus TaxID=67304 RepID=UPI001AD762F5|nr:serine/threonine-protein kinase [Streptomyces griseorubiginosus]MBO4258501.1 PQQ-binding-like beta-propeller repeat protein [Streptomyces griseorubiginosus]